MFNSQATPNCRAETGSLRTNVRRVLAVSVGLTLAYVFGEDSFLNLQRVGLLAVGMLSTAAVLYPIENWLARRCRR